MAFDDTDPMGDLEPLLGTSSAPRAALDPVDLATIRSWCGAMGDTNPVYLDESFARASAFGDRVAPATMVDQWYRQGLGSEPVPTSPLSRAIAVLDRHGFTAVVAVNATLHFDRYLRLGDLVVGAQTLEAVSPRKHTALGQGHFVTTRFSYVDQAGDPVGTMVFRMFRFRPGTARTRAASVPAEGADRPAPSSDPVLRPRPPIDDDNRFFWEGCRQHELRVQTCSRCATAYFPPTPRCSACGSFEMRWVVSEGDATLYSWAGVHHPPVPGFRYPLLVGLVELEEGVRLVADLVAMEHADLRIGMPLELCWLDSHPALDPEATDARGPISLPEFRPRRPTPRTDTIRAGDLQPGDALALCPIPVTTTLVVAGAIATRDFTAVHHDRDAATRAGLPDVFMNIFTSLGLTQRYLTDTLGPEAILRDIDVRLGMPNHPGDTMTMTAQVAEADATRGVVDLVVRGFNGTGDHLSGTATVLLPGGTEHAAFASRAAGPVRGQPVAEQPFAGQR